MLSIPGEDVGPWRHLVLAASLAEGGEQPLPPGWKHWVRLGLLPPSLVSWGRVMLVMVYLKN